MKSSGKCFLRAHRSCVPETAKVVPPAEAVLGNGKESLRWYWFWKHEGVMKSSWGSALWEAMEGHWWRCSLSFNWQSRTEGAMQRRWGLAPWEEPIRDCWWSLVTVEDSSVLEMPVPWDDHQERQQQWSTGSWSLEDKLCATKDKAEEVTKPLEEPRRSWVGSQALNSWSLIFAFDCDCALIFFTSWRKKLF